MILLIIVSLHLENMIKCMKLTILIELRLGRYVCRRRSGRDEFLYSCSENCSSEMIINLRMYYSLPFLNFCIRFIFPDHFHSNFFHFTSNASNFLLQSLCSRRNFLFRCSIRLFFLSRNQRIREVCRIKSVFGLRGAPAYSASTRSSAKR